MKPIPACPHCGAINADDLAKSLSPTRRRILYYIQRHPYCEIADIMSYVYANDPNGGPSRTDAINCHIYKMKPILAAAGLQIATRRGPAAPYRLVQKAPTQ